MRIPLKNKGFLINTDQDPRKIYKPATAAFHVGPSTARQRNAIYMAFRWRADDGPLVHVAVFGSSPPNQLKKTLLDLSWTPSYKTFWIRACNCRNVYG